MGLEDKVGRMARHLKGNGSITICMEMGILSKYKIIKNSEWT